MREAAIDLKVATANPTKYFKTPGEVLARHDLNRKAKLAILHQWETDARLLSVADDESMSGGERSQLGAVVKALLALDDENKDPEGKEGASPAKSGR